MFSISIRVSSKSILKPMALVLSLLALIDSKTVIFLQIVYVLNKKQPVYHVLIYGQGAFHSELHFDIDKTLMSSVTG